VTSDRQRYGVLLVIIAAAFVLQGAGVTGRWADVVVTGLLGAGVVIALWAAKVVRWALWLSVVVAAAVTLLSGADPGGAAMRVADALLVAVGPPAVVVGVVRGLRRRGTVTIEAVLGVLCVYLLLGMFFAFAYGAMDRLGGAPFFAQGAAGTTAHFLYFSFTTLATVGYGDLTARTNFGHTLAVSEALIGQIYLVTVVSLFVGNLRRRDR
jgi:hypothetical protein